MQPSIYIKAGLHSLKYFNQCPLCLQSKQPNFNIPLHLKQLHRSLSTFSDSQTTKFVMLYQVALTQPLKDKDDDKVLCNPLCESSLAFTKAKQKHLLVSLFSGASDTIMTPEDIRWLFHYNAINQILYNKNPPNFTITILVGFTPIQGNPVSIGATLFDESVIKV